MQNTTLLYLEQMDKMAGDAIVVDVEARNSQYNVVLDRTIFHPQGGGQPYDSGFMLGEAGRFKVNEVRFVDGIVYHIGDFENGLFKKDDLVQCQINKERRLLHSRIHSAGHVIDMVVSELNLPWKPGKGFHFPEGPYIEYQEMHQGTSLQDIKDKIEQRCNTIIQGTTETEVLFVEKDRIGQFCRNVPEFIPANKPARIVLYGDFGVPCGGTHVKQLSDIKHISIRKMKRKGSIVRIGYNVA